MSQSSKNSSALVLVLCLFVTSCVVQVNGQIPIPFFPDPKCLSGCANAIFTCFRKCGPIYNDMHTMQVAPSPGSAPQPRQQHPTPNPAPKPKHSPMTEPAPGPLGPKPPFPFPKPSCVSGCSMAIYKCITGCLTAPPQPPSAFPGSATGHGIRPAVQPRNGHGIRPAVQPHNGPN
ncbi:hypothetical protein ACFE04_029170 [Oxalis oulophora]